MQLFPAIDLRGGKVVRLTQGDYSRMTVYGEDPCAQAREFLAAGAKNLHVVDLDGAKDGTLSNYDTIAALANRAAYTLRWAAASVPRSALKHTSPSAWAAASLAAWR